MQRKLLNLKKKAAAVAIELKMTKKVVVYSTTVCPWCIKVKDFLKDNKIKYEEKNVGEDAGARSEMLEKSGQLGVPVIDIDGTIIVGFDREKIKKALGIKS